MPANRITAEVGETEEGHKEFGEIYHVVVARAVEENFVPEFVGFEKGREFFEMFFSSESHEGAVSIELGKTAGIIANAYSEEIQTTLWGTIAATAEACEWEKDLPGHLRDFLTDSTQKVLIWLRSTPHFRTHRNISSKGALQLADLCFRREATPVFVCSPINGVCRECNLGIWDFYNDPFFAEHTIAKELWFLNRMYEDGGAIASVGMMSGAMDGPAMICGKKVIFLARKKDAKRMQIVADSVPCLHWVELHYEGDFEKLSDTELREVEQYIWG